MNTIKPDALYRLTEYNGYMNGLRVTVVECKPDTTCIVELIDAPLWSLGLGYVKGDRLTVSVHQLKEIQ